MLVARTFLWSVGCPLVNSSRARARPRPPRPFTATRAAAPKTDSLLDGLPAVCGSLCLPARPSSFRSAGWVDKSRVGCSLCDCRRAGSVTRWSPRPPSAHRSRREPREPRELPPRSQTDARTQAATESRKRKTQQRCVERAERIVKGSTQGGYLVRGYKQGSAQKPFLLLMRPPEFPPASAVYTGFRTGGGGCWGRHIERVDGYSRRPPRCTDWRSVLDVAGGW